MKQNTKIKLADDVTFEQNFFQIAFAYIRDKIPNLLDYMLGFEVVNKNDDGTNAIGLFKFAVNGKELFVPVFYKNGELKGADLLYNQNQNQFIPNRENWVDSLLNSRPEELGMPSQMSRGDVLTGMQSGADLSKIYNPTRNTKLGMDGMTDLSSDFDWPLTSFLKTASCNIAAMYSRTLMRYPELHKVAFEIYGEDLYDSLSNCKAAENILLDTETVPAVEVIDAHAPQSVLDSISDADKKELIEEGVVLKDNRTSDVRIPYRLETSLVVNACHCAGVYDVLMKGGKLQKAAIVPSVVIGSPSYDYSSPFGIESSKVKQIFIPMDDGKVASKVDSSEVFAMGTSISSEDYSKFVDGLAAASSAKTFTSSGSYDPNRKVSHNVFVEADGSQAEGPYLLKDAVKNGDTTTYTVCGGCYSCDKVVVSNMYRRMKCIDRTLYVPSTAKVHTFSAKEYGHSKPDLGDARDIDARIKGLCDVVKVSKDRSGFRVLLNDRLICKEASKRDAYISLVAGLGLSIQDAKAGIKSAASLESEPLYFKKQAQPFFDPGMMSTPQIPPVPMGMNPDLGVMEQYPQADVMSATQNLPGNVLNQRIMDEISGMGQTQPALDQAAVDQIMQAAQTGDRNVFDVANISELINRGDIDVPLDQYMPDLQSAMDRLGRIYFLMMFHADKFADRFSQEDLPSLEETVRDTFLSIGELILKLKERKIEADSGSAVETDLNALV